MTTAQDLINECRNHLMANQAPESNRLSGSLNASATSFNLHYPPGTMTQRGAIISIDLEDIRVWETSGNSVTVCERGINGSTAASHNDLAFVEVMPKFSQWRILQAINEDLDDLASPWNGLFAVQDLELTFNPAVSGYDFTGVTPSQVLAVQEIRYKIPGPTKHLPAIRRFDIARNVPTADYPSGMALLLYEGGHPGLPLHVRYRSRFNHFVNLTDDAQTVALLPAEANGLPPIGAACALMAGREIKRNFTEATSDPLQLELVVAGNVMNSYKGLLMLRQQRIQAVAAGLMRQYGPPVRSL